MAENEKLEQVAEATQEAPVAEKKAEKPAKAEKKPSKKAKPGFMARIKQWCRETKAELKKVQWPTWKQTVNNTLIVLGFCLVVGVCIFAFDSLASGLFSALVELVKG